MMPKKVADFLDKIVLAKIEGSEGRKHYKFAKD